MPRISTPKNIEFDKLLEEIKLQYPDIKFVESNEFSWNHTNSSVSYNREAHYASADLLHEIGHIECDHRNYSSDISLLKKELGAWEIAKNIGEKFSISISENYINKCLESYRIWVHKRSLCSKCYQNAIEISEKKYKCINCGQKWQVSSAQDSRVYKKSLEK